MTERQATFIKVVNEIQAIAEGLPKSKKHPILNRCYKLKLKIKKKDMTTSEVMAQQAKDSANIQRAIFNAMALHGRRLTLHDSREFGDSQFHTTVCKIRKRIKANGLPYVMKDRWTLGANGHRCKEYWIEEAETC